MQNKQITRRVFIGSASLLVIAPLFLSGCNKRLQLTEIKQDGQYFSAQQLTLLTDVAEIMIPKTDTAGATDAEVIPVLDAMMITWAGKKAKQQFNQLLSQLDELAHAGYGNNYTELPRRQRQLLVTELDSAAFADKSTPISQNYRRFKELVFHIYYSSQQANPHYSLIPGGYRGCVSTEELAEINTRGYL